MSASIITMQRTSCPSIAMAFGSPRFDDGCCSDRAGRRGHGVRTSESAGMLQARADPLRRPCRPDLHAGRGGGTVSPRPSTAAKGPKVSVLVSSSSTCGWINSPIRYLALSSSACTGSPLRSLSEASSRRSLSHATARRRKPHAQLARRVAPVQSSRKSRRHDLIACVASTVHRWPSPCGPAGKAWPRGKRGRCPARSSIYHRLPQQQLSSQNRHRVMFRDPQSGHFA